MARTYSPQTLKLLFGRARQCAYPGCHSPLVFEHRSRLTVIAEIAHIRSEKPDGPRYDAAYDPALINQEENLLLLCGLHHKPVDDNESVYPPKNFSRGSAVRSPRQMIERCQIGRSTGSSYTTT